MTSPTPTWIETVVSAAAELIETSLKNNIRADTLNPLSIIELEHIQSNALAIEEPAVLNYEVLREDTLDVKAWLYPATCPETTERLLAQLIEKTWTNSMEASVIKQEIKAFLTGDGEQKPELEDMYRHIATLQQCTMIPGKQQIRYSIKEFLAMYQEPSVIKQFPLRALQADMIKEYIEVPFDVLPTTDVQSASIYLTDLLNSACIRLLKFFDVPYTLYVVG
jgi:hypothetical protein